MDKRCWVKSKMSDGKRLLVGEMEAASSKLNNASASRASVSNIFAMMQGLSQEMDQENRVCYVKVYDERYEG